MEDLRLFDGKVVDINDPNKQGRIKVRILPWMDKIKEEDLPWCVPFCMNISDSSMSNDMPSVNSTIRILIDEYWKKFYYLPNRYFYGLFDFSKIENKFDDVKDSEKSFLDKTYENLKFRLYEDGGLDFHNVFDGSHGFIHKSGSFAIFDKYGSIVTQIKNNQTYTFGNGTYTLGLLLQELIEDLSVLKTTDGQTTPQLTEQMAELLPKVKKLFK